MTAHVQRECEGGNHEYEFLRGWREYEIEHVWANRFERHRAEVKTTAEFCIRRNRLCALLLLPRSVNASFRAPTRRTGRRTSSARSHRRKRRAATSPT
ncbi:hypothetical protein [Streptosporangium sp. H16]|uniref:hypothetical protein n=1 Tax=Streptosporangium sp. H16 TaxID=3444184 RepID=UPI003F7A4592